MVARPIAPPPRPTEPSEPPGPTAAAGPGTPVWLDLLAFGLAGLGLVLTDAVPPGVRIPLGLLVMLVVPGYALAAVLFPGREHVDSIERAAVTLGMSLGLLIFLAAVLDRLPVGLNPAAMRLGVSIVSLALLSAAVVRRLRRPPMDAPATAGRAADQVGVSRAARFTKMIVVTNLLIGVLAYVLAIGDRSPPPTSFYVLAAEGTAARYPQRVAPGEPLRVQLGIQQSERVGGQYRVTARRGGRVLASLGPVVLRPGERWENDLELRLDQVGSDQEVALLLERDGEAAPYRTLRLWVDVLDGAGG